MVPLDTQEDYVLPGVSGVLVKYEVRFEKRPEWQVNDQKYVVKGYVREGEDTLYVSLDSRCANSVGGIGYRWEELKREYGEAVAALEVEFGNYSECPRKEQLGEIWSPFMEHMDLYKMWVIYQNYQQERTLEFPLEKSGCPSAYALNFGREFEKLRCVYQGVAAGRMLSSSYKCVCKCRDIFSGK